MEQIVKCITVTIEDGQGYRHKRDYSDCDFAIDTLNDKKFLVICDCYECIASFQIDNVISVMVTDVAKYTREDLE